MNARAQIQQESPIVIGSVMRSKPLFWKLWLPVHRNAPCEMQVLSPIRTGARLRIRTSDPIQLLGPIVSLHGNVMSTPSRMITPGPTCAPKARRTTVRTAEGSGNGNLKRMALAMIQSASIARPRPRSKWRFENVSRRIRSDMRVIIPCSKQARRDHDANLAHRRHVAAATRVLPGKHQRPRETHSNHDDYGR